MRSGGLIAIAALALWAGRLPADEPGEEGALFAQLDTNSDGQVRPDEVPEDKKRVFEHLLRTADKDKSGSLSREEFLTGLKERRAEGGPREGGRRPEGERPSVPDPGEIFDRFDINKDGKLSSDEVPEERRPMIAKADKDSDGALNKEEFTAFAREQFARRPDGPPREGGPRPEGGPRREGDRPGPPNPGGEMFDRADANKDGKLTADEVPEERRPMIAKADKDGDGALSKEEFLAFARENFARRPDGPPREGGPRPDGDRPREGGPPREGDRPREGGPPREGERRPMPPGGLFGILNTNGDEKLDSAEIEAAASRLKTLDKDGDGTISMQELMAAFGPPRDGGPPRGEGLRRPEGDGPRRPPADGEGRPRREGEGDGPRRPGGDADKPRREGERKEGDKPRREGDAKPE